MEMKTPTSYAILTVATNKYRDYWKGMIESAERVLNRETNITFHVFTDNFEELKLFARTHSNFKIVIHKIEPLTWPEATLLRYELIDSFSQEYTAEVLIHLDADMLFIADFTKYIDCQTWKNQIALVAHPGYWREEGTNMIISQWRNPLKLIKDFRLILKVGALGAWDNNPVSSAYVPREKRVSYVCGGVWMGKKESFLSMVRELKFETNQNRDKAVIAKWHDESHLNRWSAFNKHTTLTPSFCFDPTYSQLKNLPEFIRAVQKID